MSSLTGDDSQVAGGEAHPGYDPRVSSQQSDSFNNFDTDSVKDSVEDSPQMSAFSLEQNGQSYTGSFDPTLPPPGSMQPEEGLALREWRRQNAIRLEEKEKREKEMVKLIIEEAEEYKREFYKKRQVTLEHNQASKREKEKLFLASQEKFHAEAEKNYWKAIAELIPREVPTIEKRGKKDQDKKPSIVVIHGPKPGKPTDLSRLRQIHVKLKHNPPSHMNPKPPPPPPPSTEPRKDTKAGTPAITSSPSSSSAKVTTAPTPEVSTSA
ncbi:hypothetical protein K2173_000079 [Erythroxylum novogranatense]|uniref:Clathrin light chain n=1 Tax=Erythroxylum novogranatense TaxID=1862640 RepID=A0AAV8SPI9_9ROSI|nr:hypothetical protein K2173_000079 [Erythroxylum novogranatense]